MAPRFFELSRPLEDGVAWASNAANETGEALKRLGFFSRTFYPDGKVYQTLCCWFGVAASHIPIAKKETQYAMLASAVVLIIRWLFVAWLSRSILANYGATKAIHKEQ